MTMSDKDPTTGWTSLDGKKIKIALAHDFLVQRGGAEKVLEALVEMYPEAPIYTLLHDEEKMRGMFAGKDIRTSYLQKFPRFIRKRYRWLLPFFMVVPETFDFRDYDLVISSSGAWMKGVVTKLNAVHVSYVHSPMRFVWDHNEKYLSQIKEKRMSFFARIILNYVRIWDRLAAERPDRLIANSQYTKKRIGKYYRREAEVIYPPVGNEQQATNNKQQVVSNELSVGSYFLVVSRLSPYKMVKMVVETFNKLGLPLVVAGEGEDRKVLEKIAGENVRILGWQDEEALAKLYAGARAFIFPADDDFGIAPVEAMLRGVPVIAFRKGGALETVKEGISGEFFAAQTPEVLADGVRRFMKNEKRYDKNEIRKLAERFSKERFKKELGEYMERVMAKR